MRTKQTILMAILALIVVSCGSYYRVVTTISRDGRAVRDIYTFQDSSTTAADKSDIINFADLDNSWKVTRYDTTSTFNYFGQDKPMNVLASKSVSQIEQFSDNSSRGKQNLKLITPQETLTKEFNWFYTNFKYTGVYKKLKYDAIFPISDYLTPDEQTFWSRGKIASNKPVDDSELGSTNKVVEEKIMEWYVINYIEFSLVDILKIATKHPVSDSDKVKIRAIIQSQSNDSEIEISNVCLILDEYYNTKYFTELYAKNSDLLNNNFKERVAWIQQRSDMISFELVIPGELISSNATKVTDNSIAWKVTKIGLIFDDYTLEAEYRVVNVWFWVGSALVVLTAILSIIILIRRQRKSTL